MEISAQFAQRRLFPVMWAVVVAGGLAAAREAEGQEAAGPAAAELVRQGQQLFSRRWSADNGLGPLHNDVSCVACHIQGGVGGGGPAAKNVHVLSALPPRVQTEARRHQHGQKLQRIHPAFVGAAGDGPSSIILHHHSTEEGYDDYRAALLGRPAPSKLSPRQQQRVSRAALRAKPSAAVRELPRYQGVSMLLSDRNSTALFGAGAIDKIPLSVLEQEASRQREATRGKISGRVSPGGKFGWRGQLPTLRHFVAGACATELGLSNDGHPETASPMPAGLAEPGPSPARPSPDLTAGQVSALTAFVASLPAPTPASPLDSRQQALVAQGAGQFESVGCAQCHRRQLGSVPDIFSDLLLHDMGLALSDPLPAAPQMAVVGSQPVPISFGYSGASGIGMANVMARIETGVQREWRTPPLWGVADSAPYLHDGRAPTLDAAIRLHAGEAADSRSRYLQRSLPERQALLAFLGSLRAPRP